MFTHFIEVYRRNYQIITTKVIHIDELNGFLSDTIRAGCKTIAVFKIKYHG